MGVYARDGDDRRGVWWSGVDAAFAVAAMRAQRRLGPALSWPWVTSAAGGAGAGAARPRTAGGTVRSNRGRRATARLDAPGKRRR
jgi:hypothetical protein